MQLYEIRQCEAEVCQFRFPVAAGDPAGARCPHCGAATALVATPQAGGKPSLPTAPRFTRLELLLDNIRSLYNVGAIMRTADGAGITHLHLGGITAPPTHPKLTKTALGAESALPWTQHRNGVQAVMELKSAGYLIWVLEEGETLALSADAASDAEGALNLFTTPLPATGQPTHPARHRQRKSGRRSCHPAAGRLHLCPADERRQKLAQRRRCLWHCHLPDSVWVMHLLLVPTLGVGMQGVALCAAQGTLERPDLHSTRSVERDDKVKVRSRSGSRRWAPGGIRGRAGWRGW